ncbi:HNH endonuclease [Cupriavidus alkaliphilus]|uniref:HNH endonuclease n=1 Tax=Cupriavidus alkaliphilus TaxID=942866 RepID=UPI000DE73C25|nr:HNH endonuclease [Cupriavidus alkaliphilus]PVY69423.1 HNH endonuclease [Cupriavidus alkaliphilus]
MRCIFCKQDSNDSQSVEHIIPESLGSRKRILPQGVVCDKCNNYFARKVEQPILNQPWLRNLRAWHQVPTKKGNFPSLLGQIAGANVKVSLRRENDGTVQFATEKGSESPFLEAVVNSGFKTPLVFFVHDENVPQREMARFLGKMAIEACAEIFAGNRDAHDKFVDEPFYDRMRDFARYGTGPDVWPFYQRRIYPVETMMRPPETNEWVQAGFGFSLFMTRKFETLFAFVFYGMEFVINVGGPSTMGYEEWLEEHNGISPLVERVGCRLIVTEQQNKLRHYLEGKFELEKGFEFDRAHGVNLP